ncbi:MAG: hypothetical protein KBG28_12395 [Kofleriaceae bacterium]|jgi:hypothetical protein|nr:hypothetical protein [Kofleriaceae bacterium]
MPHAPRPSIRAYVVAPALATLALGLFAAGCAELPELGRCGNGVVEASRGEACDGVSSLCDDQCRLVCVDGDEAPPPDYVVAGTDSAGTVAYCPAGHTCGVDAICRAPSGGFRAATTPVSFAGGTVAVADVEQDQRSELVGLSQTGIQILSGPDLGVVLDLATPPASGPGVIADLDGDGLPDLAAPVEGGLALLRGDGVGFRPVLDFTPLPAEVGDVFPFVVTPPPHLGGDSGDGLFYARQGPGGITVRWFDPDGTELPALPPCALAGGLPMLPPVVARDRRQFALLVPLAAESVVVCHYQPGPPATPWRLTRTTLASAGELVAASHRPAVMANLDPDPCLELAYASSNGGVARVDAGPGCALTEPPGLLGVNFGGAALTTLLAAADLDGDGADELIADTVVLADRPGLGWSSVFLPAPAWGLATVADVDGDGLDDVVAAAGQRDDLTVLRGARDLAFAPYRVATARPSAQLVGADLDGDGVGDVAQIERLGAAGDRAMVWFGSRAGPLARAAEVVAPRPGTTLAIGYLGRRLGPTPSTSDGIDDLAVVRFTAGGARELAVLFGSVSRLLFTIHWPGLASAGKPPMPNVVTAADLIPGGQLDLAPASVTGGADLWLWDGADARVGSTAWNATVDGVTRTAGSRPTALAGRGPTASHVFLLSSEPEATRGDLPDTLVASYRGGGGPAAPVACATLAWSVLEADATLLAATVIDLGGDGLDELAVTLDPAAPRIVIYPVGGGSIAAAGDPGCGLGPPILDTRTLRDPDSGVALRCTAAAALGRGAEPLAISCLTDDARPSARVYAVRPDAATGWATRTLGTLAGPPTQLHIGDLDGDGVPDLAAVVDLATGAAVQVLAQCEAARPGECLADAAGSGLPAAR